LSPELSGRVEQVLVQAGEPVEAGQVLLRLEERDGLLADLAANELELLLARDALDQLNENAGLERAQVQRELAQAQKQVADATYHVKKVKAGTPQANIDQAHANMILAENALDKLRDELQRTERQFANKNNPILFFISNRQIKLILTVLERNVASAQRRYEDSVRKYEDLKAPVDPVELAQAEADLSVAQARLAEAERKTAVLHDGPDPDEVAAAQARIRSGGRRASESRGVGRSRSAGRGAGRFGWMDRRDK
jgi:multidrug resistance efflux pump